MKLNEIYRKTKEGENIEELRTELQNTHEKKSHEELDAELMNIENMLIGLQAAGCVAGRKLSNITQIIL